VRDGARGVLVLTGIAVIIGREIFPHLDQREHAAHLRGTELTLARHHRQRVGGTGHRHFPHVGHAGIAHRHISRRELADRLDEIAFLAGADEVAVGVAHGVHRVMRLVAMDRPVAGVVGDEFNRADHADGHVGRRLRPTRGLGNPAAVRSGHGEMMAMHVDRMVGH